mmetsp:Transcript_98885/g.284112  ORF Transcript_98885/g.284112 Transcript_98885/m.284112 type:complete len:319 (+) Transcript_98885:82-1038(+)
MVGGIQLLMRPARHRHRLPAGLVREASFPGLSPLALQAHRVRARAVEDVGPDGRWRLGGRSGPRAWSAQRRQTRRLFVLLLVLPDHPPLHPGPTVIHDGVDWGALDARLQNTFQMYGERLRRLQPRHEVLREGEAVSVRQVIRVRRPFIEQRSYKSLDCALGHGRRPQVHGLLVLVLGHGPRLAANDARDRGVQPSVHEVLEGPLLAEDLHAGVVDADLRALQPSLVQEASVRVAMVDVHPHVGARCRVIAGDAGTAHVRPRAAGLRWIIVETGQLRRVALRLAAGGDRGRRLHAPASAVGGSAAAKARNHDAGTELA